MAYKRKDGRWQVGYRDGTKTRTKTFPTKKAATDFEKEVAYKKSIGAELPRSRREGVYLDELAQQWVDAKKAKGQGGHWLKCWIGVFNSVFAEPLCRTPAHAIAQADIMALVSAHYAAAKQSTRNRYLGYLKAIFQHGVDTGQLHANPLARWRKGKESRRSSLLTLEDLQAIRAHAREHTRWAIDVAWNLPCRPGASDLFALRFDEHVKWNKGGVEVYHFKVDRWSFVQCSGDFMDALREREAIHQSGHLIEYKGRRVLRLEGALQSAARRAGLTYRPCMYDIRHLWITTALDKGVEPSVIAYLAGTSVRMIHLHYYEPHAVERARLVGIMPGLGDGQRKAKVVQLRCASENTDYATSRNK